MFSILKYINNTKESEFNSSDLFLYVEMLERERERERERETRISTHA
jgi:hypothetical protein